MRSHLGLSAGLAAFLAGTVSMLALASPAAAQAATPAPGAPNCEAVANAALPEGEVTGVVPVPAGMFELTVRGNPVQYTDLPAFCRVSATLHPSPESNVNIELWLPAGEAWNGRYVAVGNGGFAGTISTSAMVDPVRRGYAVSSTDTGHPPAAPGQGGDFALNAELAIDFAYRAVHEMAVNSERLIDAFYSETPQFSFFTGCSTGGRQAMAEVQRYPGDFDGVVAGAAAYWPTHLQGAQMWEYIINTQMPGGPLTQDQFTLLNEAVLAQCDMIDGVADRVIENPNMCAFDPRSLVGNGLTAEQAEIAAAMYAGPMSAAGEPLYFPRTRGSEGQWFVTMGENPLADAVGTFRYYVYMDPTWDFNTFDVERDVAYADSHVADLWNSNDPNISNFVMNGGKLLIYHGWADPGITPYGSVAYYEAVQNAIGPAADDSVRLFMVPGMGHCGGGNGPSSFDMLGAIDAWVTNGQAPMSLPAAHLTDGVADRTRILCPYPQQAVYNGTGDPNDAASFSCQVVQQ